MNNYDEMKKALIVEDFKPIAEIWNLTLKSEEYSDVEIIQNSNDVEESLKNELPDLVLMDINLPGKLNGIELTTLLTDKFENLNILILSIHNEPHILKKVMQSGARGYVEKNASLTELRTAIREIEKGNLYVSEAMRGFLNN